MVVRFEKARRPTATAIPQSEPKPAARQPTPVDTTSRFEHTSSKHVSSPKVPARALLTTQLRDADRGANAALTGVVAGLESAPAREAISLTQVESAFFRDNGQGWFDAASRQDQLALRDILASAAASNTAIVIDAPHAASLAWARRRGMSPELALRIPRIAMTTLHAQRELLLTSSFHPERRGDSTPAQRAWDTVSRRLGDPTLEPDVLTFLRPTISLSGWKQLRTGLVASDLGVRFLRAHKTARILRSIATALEHSGDATLYGAIATYNQKWAEGVERWNARATRANRDNARRVLMRTDVSRASAEELALVASIAQIPDGDVAAFLANGGDPAARLSKDTFAYQQISTQTPVVGPTPQSKDELIKQLRDADIRVYAGVTDPTAPSTGYAGPSERASGVRNMHVNNVSDDAHATLLHEYDHLARGFHYREPATLEDVAHNLLGEVLAPLHELADRDREQFERFVTEPHALAQYIVRILSTYARSEGVGRYFATPHDDDSARVAGLVVAKLTEVMLRDPKVKPAEALYEAVSRPREAGMLGTLKPESFLARARLNAMFSLAELQELRMLGFPDMVLEWMVTQATPWTRETFDTARQLIRSYDVPARALLVIADDVNELSKRLSTSSASVRVNMLALLRSGMPTHVAAVCPAHVLTTLRELIDRAPHSSAIANAVVRRLSPSQREPTLEWLTSLGYAIDPAPPPSIRDALQRDGVPQSSLRDIADANLVDVVAIKDALDTGGLESQALTRAEVDAAERLGRARAAQIVDALVASRLREALCAMGMGTSHVASFTDTTMHTMWRLQSLESMGISDERHRRVLAEINRVAGNYAPRVAYLIRQLPPAPTAGMPSGYIMRRDLEALGADPNEVRDLGVSPLYTLHLEYVRRASDDLVERMRASMTESTPNGYARYHDLRAKLESASGADTHQRK